MFVRTLKYFLLLSCLTLVTTAFAGNIKKSTLTMPIYFTAEDGNGPIAGHVTIERTDYGVLFSLYVKGLTPGLHEFRIDENPSCDNFGLASGDHLDPEHTGKHLGPYQNGHLGDLPNVYVTQNGNVPIPVLAPRITSLNQIKNHALVIAANKHSGKQIIACGVINDPDDF